MKSNNNFFSSAEQSSECIAICTTRKSAEFALICNEFVSNTNQQAIEDCKNCIYCVYQDGSAIDNNQKETIIFCKNPKVLNKAKNFKHSNKLKDIKESSYSQKIKDILQ